MIQDITQEEVLWRFEILNNEVEDLFEDTPYNLQEEDKGIQRLESLVCGALIYLESCGAIKFMLHKGAHYEGALFTATRHQCTKEAYAQVDEVHDYDKPSTRDIPVPVLFEDEQYANFTHLSLVFTFPDTKLGHFCERMMGYLRQVCGKRDVHVINAAVFMHVYFSGGIYFRGMRRAIYEAFMYDMWTSSLQTPSELGSIIKILLGETPEKLYDPFMRTGFNFFFSGDFYYAQAEDKFFMYSTMLFCGICGMDTENVLLEDCTQNWDPRDCDTIIASPHFAQTITSEDGKDEPISTWLLQQILSSMNFEGRKALMILPSSILSCEGKAEWLRRDIVEANLLDTVVILPANIFPKTGIAATLVLLKEGRESDAPVRFIDLTSSLKDDSEWDDENKPQMDEEWAKQIIIEKNPKRYCEVSSDDLRAHEYDWYVPRYIKQEFDIPQGYMKVSIGDLLEQFSYFEYGCGIYTDVLTQNEMSSSPFEDDLAVEQLAMSDFMDKYNEEDFYYLGTTCFVIDDSEDKLRTYYHEHPHLSMSHFAVPAKFDCYRVNPEVINTDYLRMILHDIYPTLGKAQSKAGQRLTLRNQEAVIPISVDEQKRLYEEAKLNHAIEKARKEGLDEAIDRMKQEYMMEVRMRKHDMKPLLSQLDSQAKLLAFYLDKIDGNEETVAKIREKLTGVSNAVSELRLHLNRLTEEDIYGTPEVLNPTSILKELTGTFSNYAVSLEVDEIAFKEAGIEEPQIFISPVDFSTLASTIIENAVAHAFVGDASDYRVLINFSYNQEKQMYTIDFWNNGNPMPEGMDKFRYGLKGEKGARSKGTGLGGYRVKSITRHYGGDYDVFISRTKNSTTIRVLFPKYMKDEEV